MLDARVVLKIFCFYYFGVMFRVLLVIVWICLLVVVSVEVSGGGLGDGPDDALPIILYVDAEGLMHVDTEAEVAVWANDVEV